MELVIDIPDAADRILIALSIAGGFEGDTPEKVAATLLLQRISAITDADTLRVRRASMREAREIVAAAEHQAKRAERTTNQGDE